MGRPKKTWALMYVPLASFAFSLTFKVAGSETKSTSLYISKEAADKEFEKNDNLKLLVLKRANKPSIKSWFSHLDKMVEADSGLSAERMFTIDLEEMGNMSDILSIEWESVEITDDNNFSQYIN